MNLPWFPRNNLKVVTMIIVLISSLPCVKLHKKKKNCDGKRCPTEFIDINEFDDNKLLSGMFQIYR